MFKSVRFLIWMLAIALPACADNDGSSTDSRVSSTPDPGSDVPVRQRHALATLTAERLDDYIDVLRAAAADPDKDGGDIALERGWNIGEWVWLNAAVGLIVAAGGYEQTLERLRVDTKETHEQIAEYERRLATASDSDRPMIEKGVETLRNAVVGWERTLANAEALRPGGELVESRLADIEAAKGK